MVKVLSTLWRITIGVMVMACTMGSCGGSVAQVPKDDTADIFEVLPADADLVVVVDRAAELRTTPIGVAAGKFLFDAGVSAEISPAWTGLCQTLGLDEQRAFDELMGRRVVVVTRQTPASGNAPADVQSRDWAMMFDVSAATDARLRERLTASPRAIEQGHQVLSIERGKYELTTHRKLRSTSNECTVVLTPSDRRDMLSELVANLVALDARVETGKSLKRAVLFHQQPAMVENIRAGGAADVIMLFRLQSAADPAATKAWAEYVLVLGHKVPGDPLAWRSRVIVKSPPRENDPAAARVRVSSDAVFRELASDALLTVVDDGEARRFTGQLPVQGVDLFSIVPLPESAKKFVGGRRAFWLRATGDEARMTAGMALESPSPSELAAPMDGAIARFVQRLEERFGAAGEPPMDFAGVAPGAIRVLPIRGPGGVDGGMPLVSSLPLIASWSYPQRAGAERAPGADASGWWALQIAQWRAGDEPRPAQVMCRDSARLTVSDTQGELARWVWLARIRAAALERILPASIPDFRGIRSAMKRFDVVEVRLSAGEDGALVGDVVLRLVEPGEK